MGNLSSDQQISGTPTLGKKVPLTKPALHVVTVIFNSTGKRLRRIVVGRGGLNINRGWFEPGSHVWYTGDTLPDANNSRYIDWLREGGYDGGGAPRHFLVFRGQKQTLTHLRRRGLIIEDPSDPGGDTLMLSDAVSSYIGKRLARQAKARADYMAELRGAPFRRAQKFGPPG